MRQLVTKRYCQGFTYLGLLLVIVAMGAVLGATAEVWHTEVQREKERELLFVGNQFRMAIGLYQLTHAKAYPPSLEHLLKDPNLPFTRRYLRKIYRDPITGGSEWGLERRQDGGIVGVHSLSEQHPIKIAGFSAADSSFEGSEKYSEWVFSYRPHQQAKAQGTTIAPVGGNGIMKQ